MVFSESQLTDRENGVIKGITLPERAVMLPAFHLKETTQMFFMLKSHTKQPTLKDYANKKFLRSPITGSGLHGMPWHLHIIQKSGLLRTWESHFALVSVMNFSIISPCLDSKGKVFSDNYNLTNQVDVQRLYEKYKLIICGLILCLKDSLVVPHFTLWICFIYSTVTAF